MARALINLHWTFGLRQLFLWTAAIAVGLVALHSASMTWVAAMLGLSLAILAASILLAIYRRGVQRAYWIGFATFGWLYLLFLLLSWTLGRTTSNDSPLRAHNLLTQHLSTVSYHWLYDRAFEKYYTRSTMNAAVAGGGGEAGYDSGTLTNDMAMGFGAGDPTMSGMGSMPISYSVTGLPPGPNEGDFVNVAHSLWTLVLATLGGCLAHWLYATGPGRTDTPVATSS